LPLKAGPSAGSDAAVSDATIDMKSSRKPTDTPHKSTSASGTDDAALRIAGATDVSPRQARELLARHHGDMAAAEKEARNFKAES
jgi:hypothetical protein